MRLFLKFTFLVLAAAAPGARPAGAAPADTALAARLLAHIRYLSSDSLEGRRTGDPGAEKAARYIAGVFREAGLKPAGDSGTYFQKFTTTVGVQKGPKNALTVGRQFAQKAYSPDSEFTPLGFSENGVVTKAQLMFVGYGVSAEDKGYDDYAGVDVKGKVVLFFRHLPGEDDSTGIFGHTERSRYAELRYKAGVAYNHGAVAALVVLDPNHHEGDPDEPLKLVADQGVGGAHIPVLSVRRSMASEWVEIARGQLTLSQLQKDIETRRKPYSCWLEGVEVTLSSDLIRDRRQVSNVVGLLPGTDPKGEALVVGAHYDHLGWGGQGSLEPDKHAIHHGADDNASGSAAVMELARTFAAAPAPRRGIYFTCFTGEEEGLNGSANFASHPPVTLDRVSAMINMDMIGRLRNNKVVISGTGTSPVFPAILKEAAAAESLTYGSQESGFGPSDQTSFYVKDRPVLFFFTGAHSDYHKSTDTWDKIDSPGEARIVGMVGRVTRALADRAAPVQFTKVMSDTGRASGGEGYGGGGGYGPYLGTIPDFSGNEDIKGVLLSGVREGGPAEKAGIKGGDIVVRFGGLPIANLYDYTYALQGRKPGDRVDIEVLRKGAILKVTATLGRRR